MVYYPSVDPSGAEQVGTLQGVNPSGGECNGPRSSISNATTLATGNVQFTYWQAVTSGQAENVMTATVATAAAGLTLADIGIYSVDSLGNLTLLTHTGNLEATVWLATFTPYYSALLTAFNRAAGQRYALATLAVGTTPPALAAFGSFYPFVQNAPYQTSNLPGQASLPASVTAAQALANNNGNLGIAGIVWP